MENSHPIPKGKRIFFCFSPSSSYYYSWLLLVSVSMLLQLQLQAQQTYVNNKQLDCEKNYTTALGYVCNSSSSSSSSCASYVTFRSNPTYNSAAAIGYLLGADPTEIARSNNISDIDAIPTDTLVIVPLNCSCSGYYYQHNTSYVLKASSETYFTVANNTYQGLTTCPSLIAQNPYNYRNLLVGMKITVPLRCACPSPTQTSAGVTYLLTYLITWTDTVDSIAQNFGVATDSQSIYQANLLSPANLIFPFTPILVPLKAQPTYSKSSPPPPPPSAPELPAVPVRESNSSHMWVFVGVGIGAALLLFSLAGLLVWFFRWRPAKKEKQSPGGPPKLASGSTEEEEEEAENKSRSVSSAGVRYAIGWLTEYKFEELQKATGYFGEASRIKGSVYRGCFKGDDAAVKIMKGGIVSGEINILKQINHSNIIRLSGFCVHQDNTYLVYEYAEKGALSDCLIHHHHHKTVVHSDSDSNTTSTTTTLSWKQRVQIAYDVADALNYLHNYSNPPYIHKNLKSSNVLLDGNLRAKISNFSLARTVEEQHTTTTTSSSSSNQQYQDQGPGQGGLLQLTRHVVGTHGYMAPEYVENGLITTKLDVFAFGVVMLELLSGREAAASPQHKHKSRDGADKMNTIINIEGGGEDENNGHELLLYASINVVLGGEKVREKLEGFIDPCLRRHEYPLDLAYSMAQLAKSCVAHDLNSRPTMADVFMTLSKILSSSLDWDPSDEFEHSRSLSRGR